MAALAEGFSIIAQALEPIMDRYMEKMKAYEEFKVRKKKELVQLKTRRQEKLLQLELQKEKELKKIEDEYRLLLAQLKHEKELKEQKIQQIFSYFRLLTAVVVFIILYFILPSQFSLNPAIERVYPYISAIVIVVIAYKEIIELVVHIVRAFEKVYNKIRALIKGFWNIHT